MLSSSSALNRILFLFLVWTSVAKEQERGNKTNLPVLPVEKLRQQSGTFKVLMQRDVVIRT